MVHGVAQRIAATDENANLQLVVEASAGSDFRLLRTGRLELTARAEKRLSADTDRRTAAVIPDRHPTIVRQERIVGPEQPADIGGMMNGRVKVRVVTDLGRHPVLHRLKRNEASPHRGFMFRSLGQQRAQIRPQGRPHGGPFAHESIQGLFLTRFQTL